MSGGKAGGAGKQYDYYGTIACALCSGPVESVHHIILDGKSVWSGPLNRAGSSGPATISIPDRGIIRFYWGTQNQPADATLAAYGAHPSYAGVCYMVFVDFLWGTEKRNPPNPEVVLRCAPSQPIVVGAPAAADSNFTVNPVVAAAELLTRWEGAAVPSARLHAAAWQSAADLLHADQPVGSARPLSYCAPMVAQATDLRRVCADLAAMADGWFRMMPDGTISCGLWRRAGAAPPALTVLGADDLVEWPSGKVGDRLKLPTGYVVTYTDASRMHKEGSVTVDDLRALADAGVPRRTQLRRPWILTQDDARSHGAAAVRLLGVPQREGSLTVRAERAVHPDSQPIRPGDYFGLAHALRQDVPAATLLCRCIGRTDPAYGSVDLDYEIEEVVPSGPVQVTAAPGADALPVMPPLWFQRSMSLPPAPGQAPSVHALLLRPSDTAVGCRIYYDDDAGGGSWPEIGVQESFALIMGVVSPVAIATTTIRCRIYSEISPGLNVRGDREAYLLRDWAGGDTEARDDTLLLILLKKNASTGAILYQDGGQLEWMEICSVAGEAVAVAPGDVGGMDGVWDVPVLRARMGTSRLDFPGDGIVSVEAWLIPRADLLSIEHADFATLLAEDRDLHLRFQPFSATQEYDPFDAFQERQRRTTLGITLQEFWMQTSTSFAPQWTYRFPPGYDRSPVITITSPSAFPAATDGSGNLSITLAVSDVAFDLVQVDVFASMGTTSQSFLSRQMAPVGQFDWTSNLAFPTAGNWTLSVVARDSLGQTRRRDVQVVRADAGAIQPPTFSPPSQTISDQITVVLTSPGGMQVEWQRTALGQPAGAGWTTDADNIALVTVYSRQTLHARTKNGGAFSSVVSHHYIPDVSGAGNYLEP
jgi:hypothetical protein